MWRKLVDGIDVYSEPVWGCLCIRPDTRRFKSACVTGPVTYKLPPFPHNPRRAAPIMIHNRDFGRGQGPRRNFPKLLGHGYLDGVEPRNRRHSGLLKESRQVANTSEPSNLGDQGSDLLVVGSLLWSRSPSARSSSFRPRFWSRTQSQYRIGIPTMPTTKMRRKTVTRSKASPSSHHTASSISQNILCPPVLQSILRAR